MRIVGITGSIGSGKSEVAKVFAENGAHVIDADFEVKKLLRRGEEGFKAVVEAFGKDILDREGNIDKKRLASIVFSDAKKVRRINDIIHPLVHKRIMGQIQDIKKRNKTTVVVIDAPLLIETGFHRVVDYLILVSPGDTEDAIKRAARRIGITVKEARRRLAYQIPISEKEKVADAIIINDGTLEALRKQASGIYRRMLKKEDSKEA